MTDRGQGPSGPATALNGPPPGSRRSPNSRQPTAHPQMPSSRGGPRGSVTFVHSVEDLIQVAFSVAALVFLPHGAVLTPQHHELAIPAAMGGKVGDLHNHGAAGTEWMAGRSERGACLVAKGGERVPAWREKGSCSHRGAPPGPQVPEPPHGPASHHQAKSSARGPDAQPAWHLCTVPLGAPASH